MTHYIPAQIRAHVRTEAKDRCGYCRSHQSLVLGQLEIEHIIPTARGGDDGEANLWLACRLCNGYKGVQTHGIDPTSGKTAQLYNPRRQRWTQHFSWSDDGLSIVGRTPIGRATIEALQLNNAIAVLVRRAWVSAGWHPPTEQQ